MNTVLTLAGALLLAAPEQIHLSFQNDPRTTMTVQWKGAGGAGVFEVGAAKGAYDLKFDATLEAGSGGKFFVAEATGLEPGTEYHYRVGTSGDLSQDLTFRTAPERDDAAQYRFIAFGDSRGGYPLFGQAMKQMLKDSPDLIMFTGDATVDGNNEEWDQWFTAGEETMRLVPMMPAYGNHDALSTSYTERFALPRNAAEEADHEYYYSFVYGNARFIVLNDNYALGIKTTKLDGPQFAWLENELKSAKEPWIFIFNHQPFYSASNKHGSDRNLQRVWLPLLDKYAVDMVFNGHDHNYERSKPMRNNEVRSSMADGTVFVVAAGVGAPLYENGTDYWTAKSESVENYTVIEIDGLNLKFQAKRLDGTVIDEVAFTRQPRQYAAAATSEAATQGKDSVIAGPLWHCASGRSGPLPLLMALAPLLWLRRKA